MAMKIVACILLFSIIAIYAAPQPEDDNDKKGTAAVDVQQERGHGTKVIVDGRHEVYKSEDGKTKAEVYGQWDRTYGGRNDGERSHKYGGRIEHTWK